MAKCWIVTWMLAYFLAGDIYPSYMFGLQYPEVSQGQRLQSSQGWHTHNLWRSKNQFGPQNSFRVAKKHRRDPGLGMPIHPNNPEETPRYLQHYCVHKRHQQTFSPWFFHCFQIYAKGYQVVHSACISAKQFCRRNSICCLHTPKCQKGSQGQLLSKQVHHDYDWLLSPKLMCRTDYLNHFPSTDHSTRGPNHVATHFGSCPVF